jgi:hypothetical protein
MYQHMPISGFDWSGAIAKNRDALIGIVAALFAMLGLSAGFTVERLSRGFYNKVLRVLKPAESALRRLIVIAARGLVAKQSAPRPGRGKAGTPRQGKGAGRNPVFQLFDPRVFVDLGPERVEPPPTPPKPNPDRDDEVDTARLIRRLQALKLALADLPSQAKRLVRARARRDKNPRLQFLAPMRPGRPPGYRKRPTHEVDRVLKECHWLACDVLWPNTS